MTDSIKKLTELFSKFPTIGPRTAQRFCYYLLKQPKEKIEELTNAIQELKDSIRFCTFCFNPFELRGDTTHPDLCPICFDPRRDKNILCVVEKETDLKAIEDTKKYNGLYFILGGTVGTMKKSDTENLRIEKLITRAKEDNKLTEIIIAINPTPEGKATSILVERALKQSPTTFKITHLAQGLPVGGELEYADEETLESAFKGRN
ncbi:MAG: recombination mediator RecR [Candidatus Doudnabacteria bacterium]